MLFADVRFQEYFYVFFFNFWQNIEKFTKYLKINLINCRSIQSMCVKHVVIENFSLELKIYINTGYLRLK